MIKWRLLALFAFFPVVIFAQGFASFNGQNEYAVFSDTLIPKSDFTAECFFRICDSTSTQQMTIFSSGDFGSSIIPDSGGQTALILHHGAFQRTVFLPAISASEWQHLAITYRTADSNVRVFHNGAFTDTYQRKVTPNDSFKLSSTAQPYKGFIDEFRVSFTSIYTTNFNISYSELPQMAMTAHLFGFDSLDNGAFLDENTLDTLFPVGDSLWRMPVSMTTVDSLCANNYVQLNGQGAPNYLWSSDGALRVYNQNGDTNDLPGSSVFLIASDTGKIYLTAIDINQCATTVTQQIEPFPLPVFTLGNDTTFCQSDSFAIAVQGYPGYEWSDGDTFSHNFIGTGGWHWLEVTDANGCEYRDSLLATVLPDPVVDLGEDTTLLPGYSMYLDAGSGFASYQWSTAETGQRILVTLSKEYRVTVTDTNGCTGIDDIIVFIDASSIEGFAEENGAKIFPNPVRANLNIRNMPPNSSVFIIGLNGKVLLREDHKLPGECVIKTDFLESGLYLIEIRGKDYVSRRTFVKSP